MTKGSHIFANYLLDEIITGAQAMTNAVNGMFSEVDSELVQAFDGEPTTE